MWLDVDTALRHLIHECDEGCRALFNGIDDGLLDIVPRRRARALFASEFPDVLRPTNVAVTLFTPGKFLELVGLLEYPDDLLAALVVLVLGRRLEGLHVEAQSNDVDVVVVGIGVTDDQVWGVLQPHPLEVGRGCAAPLRVVQPLAVGQRQAGMECSLGRSHHFPELRGFPADLVPGLSFKRSADVLGALLLQNVPGSTTEPTALGDVPDHDGSRPSRRCRSERRSAWASSSSAKCSALAG